MELPKTYNATDFEDQIYKLWEHSGYFNPDTLEHAKKSFSIAMPPPNATGTLHIGHAMTLVLQDLMVRYHRMIGDKTLWIPGTDHAGIATQNKVEKLLAKEGITRQQLGREEFLKRVADFVENSRATIRTQIRKMGSSCDWSRERYTLDEGLSRAVSEVFVRMYNDGLIYRDYRIVNWCPRCTSTLSDDEVKHKEEDGKLYHIKYPIKNTDQSITVATTRPETMLGDTAVAVHPDDERYASFVGEVALLPLQNREIQVIADAYVEKDFGTGALKVTPAHDLNDFALGKKYHLKTIKVIDETGHIRLADLKENHADTSSLEAYEGLDRFEAREKIVADLQSNGFLEKIEDLKHSVGICYRCSTIIEPSISLQWFISVDTKIKKYNATLKELALETVQSKKTTLVPERFEKTYFRWIDNLRDWCISRQIWFGHQLPVYYCLKENNGCGQTIVAVQTPSECSSCKNTTLVRDEDTLDTWFSSGLWTFSILGWPDTVEEKHGKLHKKGDLALYHPTSVLETGYDILFFWVARMILMSRYALGEEPFKVVYLHGLVLDLNRKKMSKSHEETLIDPLDVIPKYGTDALRLSVLVGVTPGNDLLLNEEKIASYRNFVNKLWNVARFILGQISEKDHAAKHEPTVADLWIESRLETTIENVTRAIEQYRFSQAAEELRVFTWDEFADWYLEISKIEGNKNHILLHILEQLIALWHPFTPFVTEVLYQQIRHTAPEARKLPKTLMIYPWPKSDKKKINNKAEKEFILIREIIQLIRNARAENNIKAQQKIQAIFFTREYSALLKSHEPVLKALAKLDFVTYVDKGEKPQNALFLKVEDIEIYLPLGIMNTDEERTRLGKDIEKYQLLVASTNEKLANVDFVQRAPKHIIEKEREKLSDYQGHILKLQGQLEKLR